MILKDMSPEFIRSLTFEQRMDLARDRGINGRFPQEEGLVDIIRLTEPIRILETYAVDVSVSFYSNNEPHIHLENVKVITPSSIKEIISGMRDVLKKFDKMGYDKVFTLLRSGDKKSDKLISVIGFTPIVYYSDGIGSKYTKYEMRTK